MKHNIRVASESDANEQKGGKFSLIAGILGLAVIAISIVCGCLGGLTAGQGEGFGVFEFFNFSAGSTWDALIKLMGTKTGPDLGTLLRYILAIICVAGMLIALLVMLIRGIVMFVRGMKSKDFGKACGSAFGAYAAFLFAQVAILALYSGDPANYRLNAGSIAGAVIGGAMIGAMIVLRFLPVAKQTFADKKTLLHFILTACGTLCTVMVLAFAGQPLIKAGKAEVNFLDYLNGANGPDGIVDSTTLLTCALGVIVTLLLILFCVLQLIRYFKQLSVPRIQAKKFRKATWLADTVAMFGLIAAIIGPLGIKGTNFGSAAQIVILIFALANFALAIADHVKSKPIVPASEK